MTQRNHIILLLFSIFTIVFAVYLFYLGFFPKTEKTEQSLNQTLTVSTIQKDEAKVLRVVDGDTIEVEYKGSLKKLRYIGIDTPETVDPRKIVECFGKEASGENRRIVEGKQVELEKDISETDKYGRLLRYVYIRLSDGSTLFVNDYLVRQGFAKGSTYPPDVKYQEQFLEAEREARENKRGLWGRCF